MSEMKRKYLSREPDPRGNVRWYFRKRGQQKVRIYGSPGEPAFDDAYAQLLAGECVKSWGKHSQAPLPPLAPAALPDDAASRMYIYVIEALPGLCKIGISRSPKKRLEELNTACPFSLRLKYQFAIDASIALWVEQSIHRGLAHTQTYQVKGEWFRVSAAEAAQAIRALVGASRIDVREQSFVSRPVSHAENLDEEPSVSAVA